MKKMISAALALVMVLSLSLTAFADKVEEAGETVAHEVTGTYEPGEEAAIVYSVDITWDGLDFTYTDASKGNWNPGSHVYEGAVEASWNGTGTITITNHSNTDITATPSYAPAEGYNSAAIGFDCGASLAIGTADNGANGAEGEAVIETITVTPGGSLAEGANKTTIGTITVTIQ